MTRESRLGGAFVATLLASLTAVACKDSGGDSQQTDLERRRAGILKHWETVAARMGQGNSAERTGVDGAVLSLQIHDCSQATLEAILTDDDDTIVPSFDRFECSGPSGAFAIDLAAKRAGQAAVTAGGPAPAATSPDAQPPEAAPTWRYWSNEDKMRGTTTYRAELLSSNRVRFSAPYGETRLALSFQKGPGENFAVVIIKSGQFSCDYDGCNISAKFDDDKVMKFRVREGETPGTLFISKTDAFVAKVKASKTAIIEATFFEEGDQQFTFATAGFEWPPKVK